MKKKKFTLLLIASWCLTVIFLSIFSCSHTPDKHTNQVSMKNRIFAGYDLDNPDEKIILPSILHEISGITMLDSSSIACIQDENGIIFIYDLKEKQISRHIPFHGNGDYEGITRVDDTLYVLRSDGLLYKVRDFRSSAVPEGEIPLKKLSGNDNEGLCYDRANNRLLIAHKDKGGKDPEDKNKRSIYGFDVQNRKLFKEPVYSFSLEEINRFATENAVFTEAANEKKKSDKKNHSFKVKFRPSAIAIHPVSGNLFVLSAAEHLAFVFDAGGNLAEMTKLNPGILNMPEGITFFENGDMLISNEGQNRVPTLLRFNYRGKKVTKLRSDGR